MMNPLVGAGLVEAGGDLVSAIAGNLFSGDAAKTAYKRQRKLLRDQIPLMVEGAVQAGLHPLAAIGVNPASGPAPAQVGDFSGMGAALGRATEALLTPEDKYAAKAALLDLEQRQANVDLTRAQLAGAHKALLTSGSTPGIASVIADPLTDRRMGVHDRNLSEVAEGHFGDIIGELYGIGNYARSVYEDFQKSGGLEQYIPGGSGAEMLYRYMTGGR